jgi:hypothetical protein
MALLLLQDGLVNNPKAWVRRTATRLAVRAQARQRIQADDVLEELTPTERSLVVGHRAGHALRHLARRAGLTEEQAASLLAEANRMIRRCGRRLTDVEP